MWILALTLAAIRGWIVYFQYRKKGWVKKLPVVDRYRADRVRPGSSRSLWPVISERPGATKKHPMVWFRGQLLLLTIAAIPLNVLDLLAYQGNFGDVIKHSVLWWITTVLVCGLGSAVVLQAVRQ